MNPRLVIIDDDRIFCESSRQFLHDLVEVETAHTLADGVDACSRGDADIVLLDQRLPDGEGQDACSAILQFNDRTKIIFVTAYPNFENAVRAIKAGAYDYLSKPFELEELRLTIQRAIRTLDLERIEQIQRYKNHRENAGTNLARGLQRTGVSRLASLAAETNAPVLITGETGTGKNVVAKYIHYSGPHANNPFISINCAALPEGLIEAELFGHEKGAFTGASARRRGLFEMAEGGTLMLDEICEMPIHVQSKFLGVLEDGLVRRLGGQSQRPINVRIIGATNKDIEKAVATGEFREDLYYRLSVIRIHLPPLRERPEDIVELAHHFIKKIAGRRRVTIPDREMKRLTAYHWPGNVRELRNIIERALLLQPGPQLFVSELLMSKPEKGTATVPTVSGPLPKHDCSPEIAPLKQIEKAHILYAFRTCEGNMARTARALGISLSTLKRRLRDYGVQANGQFDPRLSELT